MPAWSTTPAYIRPIRPSAVALSTYAMPAQYNGIAFRFRAPGTGDIKSVRVRWGTVTTAGTVTVRVETIDATTGKPTGTLYDANATITDTPVAGNQLFTFAVLPTTGLVAGTEYAVVVQTATAGTAHTITAYSLGIVDGQVAGNFPAVSLTNADVRTPANWAEVAAETPTCGIVLEDDSEPNVAWVNCPSNVLVVIWGTIGSGAKLILASRIEVSGLILYCVRTGTPAGDLRGRILDSSGTLVAGATVTLDKDSLTNASTKNVTAYFAAPVALPAGTYTVLWDSPDSVSGSHCFTLTYGVAWSTACRSDNLIRRTTADTTASPIVWDDTNTTHVFIGGLVLSDIPAPTFPAEVNVWYGTGQYGPSGVDYTPGKRASSIANCSKGNLASGITVDDVGPGTFTHTTDYVAKTDVVAKDYVLVGHYTYPVEQGGQEGTELGYSAGYSAGYDFGTVEQHAFDVEVVGGYVAGILDTVSIWGVVNGTYVDPANADVWHGVAVGVSPRVGTKRASSITNCTVGNVKKDVAIDDVTGTYAGAAGGGPLVGPSALISA